jgi:hypothetical protein
MTLTNYPGEEVILDGTGLVMMPVDYGYSGVLSIKKTDYVHISGLHVQNSQANGIDVSYSDHAIIDHNFTYNTVKSGISLWVATNVIIDGNDIELACNPTIAISPYYVSEENLTVSASVNVEVMNNLVHKASNIGDGWAGGEGINIKDSSHDVRVHNNVVHLDERPDGKPSNRLAYGLDAWNGEAYNVYYYNNIAYNSAYGVIVESEAGGNAHDIYVYNNLAYNNRNAGFALPNWEQKTATKRNIQFINNTAYNNGYGFWGNVGNVEAIIVRNNIFSQNKVSVQLLTGTESQFTIDHNLFYGSGGTYGTNLIVGDPKFVNSSGADFHLLAGSPAIDAGLSLNAPNNDFDGNVRPQGLGYDIGAYEFVSGATPTSILTPTPTVQPTATPMPTSTLTPTSTIKPGDANGDGQVNETDFTIWLSHFGQTVSGVSNGDYNGDGMVNGIDYVIWLNNYNSI